MSTLLCVPIMAEDAAAALADAQHAKNLGADLVEFRVDHLFSGEGDEQGASACEQLVRESPLPCILTCRPTFEGGDYDGDDAARIALYERLGTLDRPPRYIDVEHAVYTRSANLRQKVHLAIDHPGRRREHASSLILSTHDFKARPANLFSLIHSMRECEAASVLKYAWTARSLRDNIEALDLLRERDRPTIALAMGEAGLMSRVLAPKFGGFLTFASLRDESATAPGQPTITDLLNLYRLRAINTHTSLYGVIGWPVAHSKSPLIHNAGFEALDHNAVYLPMPIPPEWEHFKATLLALLDATWLGFRGASVTIPHKEHLLRLARSDTSRRWIIEDRPRRAGAANTITIEPDGAVRITNTDIDGVIAPLTKAAGGALNGRIAAVLGAGGAARAAALGLLDSGAHVTLFNRSLEKAQHLARELSDSAPDRSITAAPWDQRPGRAPHIIINATPLGMSGGPDPDASPLDDHHLAALDPAAIIMDTVYTPANTPLLRTARKHGLTTLDGIHMFIAQAAAQFQAWTARPAPIALFERILHETEPPQST